MPHTDHRNLYNVHVRSTYRRVLLPEALYGVLVDTTTAQTYMTAVSVCHAKKRAKKQGSIHPLRLPPTAQNNKPLNTNMFWALEKKMHEYQGDVQRLKEPRCITSIVRTHSPSQLRTSQRGGERKCDCDIVYITVSEERATNGKRTTSDSRSRFLKKER